MAKGGSNVKKGFATYLLILFIAIIAAFFIIVTIMLFSPFKPLLGFKYFTFRDDKVVTTIKESEEDIPFNFANIENISVDCGFATVSVERVKKVEQSGIKIVNKSAGFAREDQDTSFSYEIYYSDNAKKSLVIEVSEPEGFVFFNRNINICLQVGTKAAVSFENTNININNTHGNIYIGNSTYTVPDAAEHTYGISIKSLNIKTVNSYVQVYDNIKNIEDLFLKTTKGNVYFRDNINVDNFNLQSSGGRIQARNIFANSANLNLGNSKLEANNFTARNVFDLSIKSGYIDIDNFTGNLTTNKMIQDMGSGEININNVNGNISIPNANNSKINLKKVQTESQVFIRGKDCKINIGELNGDGWFETTSGSVNIKTKNPFIDINTNSGNIDLVYDCAALPQKGVELYTKKGKINLKIRQNLSCVLNVENTKGETRTSKNVYVEGYGRDFKIPLPLKQDSTLVFKMTTNERVDVSYI